MLIERAGSQMISARSMTATKLVLYLEKLKLNLKQVSRNYLQTGRLEDADKSVVGLWIFEKKKFIHLRGQDRPLPMPDSSRNEWIFPYQNNYLLILPLGDRRFVWLFSDEGISELFSDRKGLGTSGEVYLVGKDLKIKSASRHIKDWSNISVENDSVKKAFKRKDGVHVVHDYRQKEVVSAYSNFLYDGLEFAILGEIDLDEVLFPLKRLLIMIYAIGSSLLLVNLAVSFRLTKAIWNKVLQQNDEIELLNREKEKRDQENALQIFRVQENERERISFSLHDSVGQYLTVLKWGLSKLKNSAPSIETARDLEQLSSTCDDIIIEIREISHDLMPTLIKDFGVASAIKDYLGKQQLLTPLKLTFKCSEELFNMRFKREFEVNLYRMVQELFQNVIKHAGATSMEIHLKYDSRKLILFYKDDGIGMSQDQFFPRSLNYRTKLFGGRIEKVNGLRGLEFQITFNVSDIKNA